MTYEEWLPGWLARQKERRKRLRWMIYQAKLRAALRAQEKDG